MSNLLSALFAALETSLPERVARGETSVDRFVDTEGLSLDEISKEIKQATSAHSEWKMLLSQHGNDTRAVFTDQQLLNGLIAIVSKQTENQTLMMTSGGHGQSLQAGNLRAFRGALLKTNRSLDQAMLERAESLTESNQGEDIKERIETPCLAGEDQAHNQEHSNHSRDIKDYWRFYAAGRRELGKASLKTLELDIAKQIVRYQINRFKTGFISHLDINDKREGASTFTSYVSIGSYTANTVNAEFYNDRKRDVNLVSACHLTYNSQDSTPLYEWGGASTNRYK